jgi:hypothetical protein
MTPSNPKKSCEEKNLARQSEKEKQMGYGGQTEACAPSLGRQLTISERLNQQRKDLIERLYLIEKAIKAVEEVPNLQQALDAISKVGF